MFHSGDASVLGGGKLIGKRDLRFAVCRREGTSVPPETSTMTVVNVQSGRKQTRPCSVFFFVKVPQEFF